MSTQPQSESKPPRGSVLFDVWMVMHLTTAVLDDALDDVGISADEFGLYSLIYYYGPLTPTQIARSTGLSPTTVSTMLKRIRSRGHLDEAPHPDDGRSRLISISAEGRHVEERALNILADVLVRLGDHLAEPRSVRARLEELDSALRALVDLDPRPYQLARRQADAAAGEPTPAPITYTGEPLTADERVEVRDYIDWVRSRR